MLRRWECALLLMFVFVKTIASSFDAPLHLARHILRSQLFNYETLL
mgnify:CR=1 FL=1|jgi:hypothetical protein